MRTALRLRFTQQLIAPTSRSARSPINTRPFSSCDKETPCTSTENKLPVQQHWLDRRFPGVRQWLEAKNRRWWLKGITAWCRKYPALQGQETQLQTLIEQSYQHFYARHGDRLSDERSQTHLQVACLVLATYKTLLPWIKNHQELADIIRAHMGEQISPALRFLLQSTLYLSPNPYKTMSNRLKGFQQDYGEAFDTEFTHSDQQSSLHVKLCFYHDIFAAEDVPQLAQCCCCSQDRIWFHKSSSRGVIFSRTTCIADGDANCKLIVEQ